MLAKRYEYIGKDKTGKTDNDLFNPVYEDAMNPGKEVIDTKIETYRDKKELLIELDRKKDEVELQLQMMIDAMNPK